MKIFTYLTHFGMARAVRMIIDVVHKWECQTGTDPEINQRGWLGRLVFRFDLSYIVSIAIAAKFKDMKSGVYECCLVHV